MGPPCIVHRGRPYRLGGIPTTGAGHLDLPVTGSPTCKFQKESRHDRPDLQLPCGRHVLRLLRLARREGAEGDSRHDLRRRQPRLRHARPSAERPSPRPSAPRSTARATPWRSTDIVLDVHQMTCASCVARVEKALKAVPGVLDATANLAQESATVTRPRRQRHRGRPCRRRPRHRLRGDAPHRRRPRCPTPARRSEARHLATHDAPRRRPDAPGLRAGDGRPPLSRPSTTGSTRRSASRRAA
jgi:hypothetical protein